MTELSKVSLSSLVKMTELVLGLRPETSSIAVEAFVREAIRDVISVDNMIFVSKTYEVEDATQVDLPEGAVYITEVEGPSSFNVVPGKILFPKYTGKVVVNMWSYGYDDCDIIISQYQDKAIVYSAAYNYAITIPDAFKSSLPFIREKKDAYCISAASNATYRNFLENKEKLLQNAKYIFA